MRQDIAEKLKCGKTNACRLLRNRVFLTLLLLIATVLIMTHFAMARNLLIVQVDGQLVMLETYERDVETAFARTGVEISDEYAAHLRQASFNGGVSVVTLDSTHTVTVQIGCNAVQARANGETVGAVLARLGIELGIDDIVEPAPGTRTRPGMTISVVRVASVTSEYTETVPYENRRVGIYNLDRGRERIGQQGIAGERLLTYNITLRDGIEVSRERVDDIITVEPQEHIVEYGTRVPNIPPPTTVSPFLRVIEGGVPNHGQGWGPSFDSRGKRQGSGIICETGGTLTLCDGTVVEYIRAYDMAATAYTSDGTPSNRLTAIGTRGRLGVAAVDPRVIPLGTNLLIVGANGQWSYGFARAENVGGLVLGYILDVYFPTRQQVNDFGRRTATVYVLR